jgi:DMSO/TMAO reductase YedYZ heme-binding membrane subunit
MNTDSGRPEAALEARDRAALGALLGLPTGLLLLTFAYATTRYVVFGPWTVGHIPLYVLNKAISWSALWLVALALALGPLARLAPGRFARHLWRRRYFGIMGFLLGSLHVVMSLVILNYAYYRQFFRQAFELTALAEFSMAMGALAWFLLLAPLAGSLPGARALMSARYWQLLQKIGVLGMLLGGLHVSYGVPGWLTPAAWYGGLPPITLWSASAVVIALALRMLAPRSSGDAQ